LLLLPGDVRAQLEEADVRIFLENLATLLLPNYTLPNIGGGHDWPHVFRMLRMGPEIRKRLDFDLGEFCTAVILHNLDRSTLLRSIIKERGLGWIRANFSNLPEDEGNREAMIRRMGLELYTRDNLSQSPFDDAARDRIVVAVLEHAKKDDELDKDSTVLTALRIADKLDRFGALGVLASAAFRGNEKPAYDPARPFSYASTEEGKLQSLYNDLMRILEWYAMLPFDWAREMVDRRRMWMFVNFIRDLGEEIADATGVPNAVEKDIEQALGPHYGEWCMEQKPF